MNYIVELKISLGICIDADICFLFIQAGPEAAPNAGTSSVLLLKFAPSPRTAGLSERLVVFADDCKCPLLQPSRPHKSRSAVISLNHTEWFSSRHQSR